jgi:hypothetical protein
LPLFDKRHHCRQVATSLEILIAYINITAPHRRRTEDRKHTAVLFYSKLQRQTQIRSLQFSVSLGSRAAITMDVWGIDKSFIIIAPSEKSGRHSVEKHRAHA